MGIATSSRSLMSGRIRLHYASILISTLRNSLRMIALVLMRHAVDLSGLWTNGTEQYFLFKGRATQTSVQNLLLNHQLVRRPLVERPHLAQGYHYGLPVLTTRFSLTLAAYQSI